MPGYGANGSDRFPLENLTVREGTLSSTPAIGLERTEETGGATQPPLRKRSHGWRVSGKNVCTGSFFSCVTGEVDLVLVLAGTYLLGWCLLIAFNTS